MFRVPSMFRLSWQRALLIVRRNFRADRANRNTKAHLRSRRAVCRGSQGWYAVQKFAHLALPFPDILLKGNRRRECGEPSIGLTVRRVQRSSAKKKLRNRLPRSKAFVFLRPTRMPLRRALRTKCVRKSFRRGKTAAQALYAGVCPVRFCSRSALSSKRGTLQAERGGFREWARR